MDTFQLSNSRLLYKKSKIDSSWVEGLSLVDRAIEEHPRLQRSSNQFHLYFFKPGAEINSEDEIWVAREISGFLGKDEFDDLATYDLARGQILGKDLELGQKLALEDVLSIERELRSMTEKVLAPTWRLSFLPSESGLKHRIGLFLA